MTGTSPSAKQHKTVLPLTGFATLNDAARITNEAFDRLAAANLTGANVTQVVAELFSELANNAVEHSAHPIGAFGWIQFVDLEQGSRFVCVVADGGIGVKEGLWKNPALKKRVSYDWDALEFATRERVERDRRAEQGNRPLRGGRGCSTAEGLVAPPLGTWFLEIREDRESSARRTRLFPGTLAYLAVPA